MADLNAALLTQLKNIQTKTGQTLAQLFAQIEASGLSKHGERRSWLMERHNLGYGDANTVVTMFGKPLPAGLDNSAPNLIANAENNPLDAIYSGKKVALLPLHEAVMASIHELGDFEIAPKKTYLSLRRNKQFAMVGPGTVSEIEIGLNCKTLPPDPRLKFLPAGGMCQATTRLSTAAQIDATLITWLRAAYDAAI